MIRDLLACACAAAIAATALMTPAGAAAPQTAPQATFRSGASAVMVDVSVRDRSRRAVRGLKAGDFQVRDNGVLQQVDDVSYGKLPIDVTVALDVSHSVTGNALERLRRGVRELMDDLGPQDRLKLVLFNMRVMRTVDFTKDVKAVDRALQAVTAGGGTSLFDAVSVALVSASEADRRQLIVVFTDGNDSTSTTSGAMLTDVARRTRATVAFVVPVAGTSSAFSQPLFDTRGKLITSTPLPTTEAPRLSSSQFGFFRTLALETGGTILPVTQTTNLSAAFRSVLDEFRSAYVLYYTARGVDRAGFHTIEVKVNREGAVVQARRGYFAG